MTEPTTGTAHRIPVRRRVLYVLIVLVLILGLPELGVRLHALITAGKWSPSDYWWSRGNVGQLYEAHPYLVRVPRPGYEGLGKKINSLGLRGPEISRRKPRGAVRVLCLGGSSTFCNTADEGESWPALLEAGLRERDPGTNWQVLNGGVSGFTTAQSLINLALRLLVLEPDIVIVYHAYNDIFSGAVTPFRSDYATAIRTWGPDVDRRGMVRAFFEDHSLAYAKLRIRVRSKRKAPPPVKAALRDEAVATFRRNLVSIAALTHQRKASVLLLTQGLLPAKPEVFEEFGRDTRSLQLGWEPDMWNLAVRRYHDSVRDACEASGARFVDAAPIFATTREDFRDPVHLTARGREKLASFLTPIVLESR